MKQDKEKQELKIESDVKFPELYGEHFGEIIYGIVEKCIKEFIGLMNLSDPAICSKVSKVFINSIIIFIKNCKDSSKLPTINSLPEYLPISISLCDNDDKVIYHYVLEILGITSCGSSYSPNKFRWIELKVPTWSKYSIWRD